MINNIQYLNIIYSFFSWIYQSEYALITRNRAENCANLKKSMVTFETDESLFQPLCKEGRMGAPNAFIE